MPTDLPPQHHRLADDRHPTPFSAEQIRAACAPGRLNAYLVVAAGADAYVDTWWFESGDEEGAEMAHLRSTAAGVPLGEPETSRATWRELQAHASYPAATTEVTTGQITTAAGTFDAWCYLTRGEAGEVTRAWFARTLPGPPVLMVTEKDGTEVFRYELREVVVPWRDVRNPCRPRL